MFNDCLKDDRWKGVGLTILGGLSLVLAWMPFTIAAVEMVTGGPAGPWNLLTLGLKVLGIGLVISGMVLVIRGRYGTPGKPDQVA